MCLVIITLGMSALEMLLGEGTKGRILDELLEGGRSTRELADLLKIRESAVRMHLERMVEMGVLVSSFHREGIGRPRKRFSLTPAGHELFARRYDMALETLMEVVIEKEGEAYAKELFIAMGRRLAENLGKGVPGLSSEKSIEERAQAVVKLFNSLGQKAKLSKSPEGLCILSHNCIFRANATSHPTLYCDLFHRGMVERMLSPAKVRFKETIGRGNKMCIMMIPSTASPAERA
jgi:predicted ArsR family transcriptional regulator